MENKPNKTLISRKGIATVETLPLLVIFVILFSYGMGLFGVIHSAILYSIGARTYAFETFRNRTDLTYFRGNIDHTGEPKHYYYQEVRLHGINQEGVEFDEGFIAGRRDIAFGRELPIKGNDPTSHNEKIHNLNVRNRVVDINPVWIMIHYGICIRSNCGD